VQRKEIAVIIEGITGQTTPSTMKTLPIKGKALCIPHAKANLLSVGELITAVCVFDDNAAFVVEGTNSGDGFWTCRLKGIKAFPVLFRSPNLNETNLQHRRSI
jgi:hypothetical protein